MRKRNYIWLTLIIMLIMLIMPNDDVNAATSAITPSEIWHTHDGNTEDGGLCYEAHLCGSTIIPYQYEGSCGGYLRSKPVLSADSKYATFDCSVCGVYSWGTSNADDDVSHWYNDYWQYYTRCQNSKTLTGYKCSTCSTAYTSTGVCTKIDGYDLDCPLSETEKLGEVNIGISDIDFTNSVITLTPTCTIPDMIDSTQYIYKWDITIGKQTYSIIKRSVSEYYLEYNANLTLIDINDNILQTSDGSYIRMNEDGVITTDINGTYKYTVDINSCNITGNTVSYTVSNIDKIAPTANFEYSKTEYTNENVTVSITATDDYSGLAAEPFSYDNGYSWVNVSDKVYFFNGAYDVWIKDKAGNIKKEVVTISNIDKVRPTITSVVPDKTEWTNEDVTISVVASDDYSGLADTAYSYDDGSTWVSNATYTVSVNGTYTISVKDKAGNVSEATLDILNIDKVFPTINEVRLSEVEYTNEDVTITVVASDDYAGLADNAYSYDGGGTWTNSTTYTASVNGTYYISVKDKAGNIREESVTISNIDKVNPSITDVEVDETEWTNEDVTISVVASDDYAGLADNAYSYDNGSTWVNNTTYIASVNGTYDIFVKDKAGNIESTSIQIDNIDKTIPEADISQQFKDGQTEVTIAASDRESGLAIKPYSYDSGSTWVSGNTNSYTSEGVYPIWIKDNAGNINKINYEVKVDIIPPTLSVSYSKEYRKEDVMIKVSAEDKETGLHEKPYSYDGGNTWTDADSYVIENNGIYEIYARDNAGNIAYKSISITTIDRVAPVITDVIYSTDKPTGKNVIVTIMAEDKESGLNASAYSFDKGKTWVSSGISTIQNNGVYSYTVRDAVGNITEGSYEVSNIRKSTLKVEGITSNNNQWTNTSVILTVNISNEAKAELCSRPYKWNNGDYGVDNSITVSQNGLYTVTVKDIYDNEVTVSYKVTNIDTVYPDIVVTKDNAYTNGEYDIVISASDTLSGIQYMGYSFDDGITWGSDNTKKINEAGIYLIAVRDNAGNISRSSIVFEPEEFIIYNDGSDTSETEVPRKEEVIYTEITEVTVQDIEIPEIENTNETYVINDTPEIIQLESEPEPEVKAPVMTTKQIVTVTTTGTATTTMLCFAGFCFFSTTPIYAVVNNQRKLVSRVRIRRKNGKYSVKIRKKMLEKLNATEYVIVFKDILYKGKQGKELEIIMPDETISKIIDREVSFK